MVVFFLFRLVGSKPHVSLAGEPSAVLCHVVIMNFYEVMRRNLNPKNQQKGKKDKARGYEACYFYSYRGRSLRSKNSLIMTFNLLPTLHFNFPISLKYFLEFVTYAACMHPHI